MASFNYGFFAFNSIELSGLIPKLWMWINICKFFLWNYFASCTSNLCLNDCIYTWFSKLKHVRDWFLEMRRNPRDFEISFDLWVKNPTDRTNGPYSILFILKIDQGPNLLSAFELQQAEVHSSTMYILIPMGYTARKYSWSTIIRQTAIFYRHN